MESPGRTRLLRAGIELVVIFAGVSGAFFVEGYRDDLERAEDLRFATAGILTELDRHEVRTLEHADSIRGRIALWEEAALNGVRAVPPYYLIPGSPFPPTAAWDAAISSGVASLYEPTLRLDLGYYFAEFVGIHLNYVRRLEFMERELLPRARAGPEAFYDDSGRLLPEFEVEMMLLSRFADDLAGISEWSARLKARLAEEG